MFLTSTTRCADNSDGPGREEQVKISLMLKLWRLPSIRTDYRGKEQQDIRGQSALAKLACGEFSCTSNDEGRYCRCIKRCPTPCEMRACNSREEIAIPSFRQVGRSLEILESLISI